MGFINIKNILKQVKFKIIDLPFFICYNCKKDSF